MFRWLMTTINVTNEFVINLKTKDLGIEFHINLKTKDLSSPKCHKEEKDT